MKTPPTRTVIAVAAVVAIASATADAAAVAADVKVVNLGKALFFDPRFSADGTISCATCHDPGKAFADGRPLAHGIHGQTGTRNTPTLLDLDAYHSFFWDGRADSLEAQLASPLTSPSEMGLSSTQVVESLIQKPPSYEPRFQELFGDSAGPAASYAHFADAIVAYERSLLSGRSRFDRYYLAGELDALAEPERRGFELFTGRGHCHECHQIDDQHAWFTDGAYRPSGGSPVKTRVPVADLARSLATLPLDQRQQRVPSDPDVAALGRFVVTLNPNDIGSFRTPSLRNIAFTAPYMHDGSIETLPEAIDWELYVRGGQLGQPIDLSPSERSDLLAFLNSLTSEKSADK